MPLSLRACVRARTRTRAAYVFNRFSVHPITTAGLYIDVEK